MQKVGKFASEVYSILSQNSHVTAGEAFEIYKLDNPATIRSRNEVAKRISDLQRLGLVSKVSMTECSYTGALATTWTTTGRTDGIKFTEIEKESKFTTPPPAVNAFGSSFDKDDDCEDECYNCEGCDCDEDADETPPLYDLDRSEKAKAPTSLNDLDRSEKAKEITRLAEERCEAVDSDDQLFLRDCKKALDLLDKHPIYRTLFKMFGLMGKVKQMKKALRYF